VFRYKITNKFGLKNFDLVFVFKDFTKPVVHINTIPSKQLENIKEWLDSVDIAFSEGPVNLSWPQIMKTINDDPKAFFEEAGGWYFLHPEGSNQSGEESGSEFSAASDASEFSESDSSESDFSESGSDSDASQGEEGSESGEDWDDLEKKAEAHDRKRRDREEIDGDQHSKNSKHRRH
jgi:nucleosome binding factor SPN SPT16 subunit